MRLFCVSVCLSILYHSISIPFPPPYLAKSSSGPLLVLAALTCLLVLLLPLHGEQPDWPAYLHITVNQKLIAAFVLGIYI